MRESYSSIKSIGRAVWEKLTTARGFWASYDWLLASENNREGEPRYLVVRDVQGQLVGALPGRWISDRDVLPFYNAARMVASDSVFGRIDLLSAGDATLVRTARERLAKQSACLYPSLAWCVPGFEFDLAYNSDLDATGRESARHALLDFALELAVARRVDTCAFLYVSPSHDWLLHDILVEQGYYRVLMNGSCTLELQWDSFEEYILSFSSRRRSAIRREMRRFVSSGLLCDVTRGGEAMTDDLAVLQANVRQKYGLPANQSKIAGFNDALRQVLGDSIVIFRVWRGEQLLAFSQFFVFGGALYNRSMGLNYELIGPEYTYFNVLYYYPIRWAIENGMTRIYYGVGSYEAKVSRGCALERRVGYFRFPEAIRGAAHDCLRLQEKTETSYLTRLET